MTETNSGEQRIRGRSPSYPAIDLEAAVQKVKKLYDIERQHPTPAETVARHWNYKGLSGSAVLSLAALKKFGLIEIEGTGPQRKARVSKLAVNILLNPDADERLTALKQAALRPSIHRELWDKYGAHPPSEANLRWELTQERAFTERGASEFIPQYLSTISFAKLTEDDSVQELTDEGDNATGDATGDSIEDVSYRQPGQRQRPQRQQKMSDDSTTYAVPVAVGSNVMIEGRFPLSEREWTQFMAVLNAMKPALVSESVAEQSAAESSDSDGN